MQNNRIFIYATRTLQLFLTLCIVISLFQNYIFTNGTIHFLGVEFTQFYDHVEVRIIPLLWVSIFLVPVIQRIFKIKGNFYASQFIISLLVAVDGFTHINGIYSYNFAIFGYQIWFDKIMHFSEGVVLLLAFYPIMYRYLSAMSIGLKRSVLAYWLTTGFISIFFIIWEILELLIDNLFETTLITSRFDTNEDLTAAYIGIIIAVLIMQTYKYVYQLRNKSVPMD